jgi:hypothetical protein
MTHPIGDARSRRLDDIVQDLKARTPRPDDMADGVFAATIRRIAMSQLVDEELRACRPDRLRR